MFPRSICRDRTNHSRTDAELRSKFSMGYVTVRKAVANFNHHLFGQLGIWMLLAKSMTAFCKFIANIVFVRSEEQMLRTNTKAVVAPMKNMKPFRDRPVSNLVGYPMSTPLFSIITKDSIAPCRALRPLPASFGLTNPRPEVVSDICVAFVPTCPKIARATRTALSRPQIAPSYHVFKTAIASTRIHGFIIQRDRWTENGPVMKPTTDRNLNSFTHKTRLTQLK